MNVLVSGLVLKNSYDLHIIEPQVNMQFLAAGSPFFQTTHSAMQSFGVSIATSQGSIVYSGDFIVEYTNSARYKLDLNSIAKIAEKDVLCLLSESTAAEKTGYTSPNHRLTPQIEPVFRDTKGRIFIALYDQSSYNIEELVQVCGMHGRKIAFFDVLTEQYFTDFKEVGLPLIKDSQIISNDDLLRARDQDICILMLGVGERIFDKIIALTNRQNKDKKNCFRQ